MDEGPGGGVSALSFQCVYSAPLSVHVYERMYAPQRTQETFVLEKISDLFRDKN